MGKNKHRPRKKFVAIGKIGNAPNGAAVCFKHWTNNINVWIFRIAPRYNFYWINFYYNTGENKGQQFASWTKNKGLFTNIRESKK